MTQEAHDTIAPPPPIVATSRLTFDGPKGPLFKAMAEARKHFQPLGASATADVAMKNGGKYQFSYCPLDVVLESLAPGLQAAGLALMQPFDGDALYTIVACGESSMTIETPLPTWSTPQELGSLLTYLRRYQIKGVFGVADSEDDDGNAASGNKAAIVRKEPTAPKSPASKLDAKLTQMCIDSAKKAGLDKTQFAEAARKVNPEGFNAFSPADAEKFLEQMAKAP